MASNYLTVSLMLLLVARRLGWIGVRLSFWLLGGVLLCAVSTISPGLGGFVMAIGTWVWILKHERRPIMAKAFLTGGLLVGLLFVLAMAVTLIPHPTAPFPIHVPLIDIELAPAGRLIIWIDAVRNFLADPLLGRGIGADAVDVRYQNPSGYLQTLTDAHNMFLNVAVQTGVVGLAALTAIVVFVWRHSFSVRLLHEEQTTAVVGLGIAFLIAFAYEGLGGSFEDARHHWVLFGLFLGAKRLPEDQLRRTGVRPRGA